MDIDEFFEMYGKHRFETFRDLELWMHSFKEQITTVEPGESEHGAAVIYTDGDDGLIVFTANDQEGRDYDAFAVFLIRSHYCVLCPTMLAAMLFEIERLNNEMQELCMEEEAA